MHMYVYIYITAEKNNSCSCNNFKQEKVLWKEKNISVRKCWYKIIVAGSPVCSDCCASFWEFNIATNPACGWQLMAWNSGSEHVVRSVNLSLREAEIFQIQSSAPCCLWSLPVCPVKATTINTWHMTAVMYWLCILSMVYCVCCLLYVFSFPAWHPPIHWPFGAKFPLGSRAAFCVSKMTSHSGNLRNSSLKKTQM